MTWSEYFEKMKGRPIRPLLRKALEMLPAGYPKNAIDLGCGIGTDTLHLLNAGWQVLAVEKEVEGINHLKSQSKVLNSSAHLNPDQLFAACEYLKLSTKETDFLLLLRESQVATNLKRAEFLKARIKKVCDSNLKTESAIKVVSEGRWRVTNGSITPT